MELTRDFKDFVKSLNENNTKYLIVGGYSVIYYGHPRYTGDIDIWVSMEPKNAELVKKSLDDYGFIDEKITAKDFEIEDNVIQIGYPPYRIDILTTIEGLEFDDCYKRRTEDFKDDVCLCIISKEDLLINKKAVGRHKDLDDFEHLSKK